MTVRLSGASYEVHIGSTLIRSSGDRCRDLFGSSSCAIISDRNVARLYVPIVHQSLRVADLDPTLLTIDAGEQSKSLQCVENACDRLVAAGLDRNSFILALGGGVVGDLAGFVAAIFMRGIPYVQIPTTLVAQVDSSVGGKTGVNAAAGKNLIGAFHQPRLVLADVDTLRTLPEREFNSGMAEVIKHGIIRDRAMLESLKNFDREDLAPLVTRNVEIKAAIVSRDERETSGERALLNFGHTLGHAIENAAGYGHYLHGEAISLGIIAACRLSMRKAGFSQSDFDLVLERLGQFKLPTHLPKEVSTASIMTALSTDKKFQDGNIRYVLAREIGDAFLADDVTPAEIGQAVEELRL
ncbi:MAG: 3-dehydroquinate synthase [Verrucomicrobiota bacterium]|nr:3-dehydroquinate synthase [Verrucomicrobiota bacterium]